MSKNEVVNLKINKEKLEDIIVSIDEEAERRANEKFKSKVKKVFSTLALVGTMAGVVIGIPVVMDSALEREEEYLQSKAEQEQAYLNGERSTISDEEAFINDYHQEDFEVEGNGWTGSYRTR